MKATSFLPRPTDLGFPERFEGWRKHQDDAILDLASSDRRFLGLVAPTGSGKSLTYMAYARLADFGRVCVLTSTRALQDQLGRDFEELDIRGQANYPCVVADDPETTVAEGACHFGVVCDKRDHWVTDESGEKVLVEGHGCDYYDRLKEARRAPIVVTNYSFWLASNRYSGGLGQFDLLVCDEADAAEVELAGFLSFHLGARDCWEFTQTELPGDSEGEWRPWMVKVLGVLEARAAWGLGRGSTLEDARWLNKARRIAAGIGQILGLKPGSYLAEKTVSRRGSAAGMTWNVVNPGPYAEEWMFLGIPRVVLSGATVRTKTFDLLGIKKDEREMLEYPSTFPVARRPVYVVEGAPRMNYRTEADEKSIWIDIIDRYIDPRRERGWRGIVHTVSYQRAREVVGLSRHSDIMITNDGSDGLSGAMERFRRSDGGILVSPSVTTGVDLPYDAARYQVISKIPYPDMRSKVLRARMKEDPEYPAYVAAQAMVQATGRVCRAEDDYGETCVVDGNYGWFMSKYAAFTPRWWRAAVRRVPRTRMPRVPEVGILSPGGSRGLTHSPRR